VQNRLCKKGKTSGLEIIALPDQWDGCVAARSVTQCVARIFATFSFQCFSAALSTDFYTLGRKMSFGFEAIKLCALFMG
jgi:hypothetical protein